MFFSSSKISELENTISSLNRDKSELSSKVSTLESSNYSLEQQNMLLEREKKELESKIMELNRGSSSLKTSASSSNSSSKELEKLFEYENINLKVGLLDIQENIADSTNIAKESLARVDNLSHIQQDTKNHLNSMISELDGLSSSSSSVSSTITNLDTNASEISKAINMINEIVLQINILSLNASVEAASAGEAGKGFAVVAQEVKNLATKTSEAAKYIENIVKSIQDSVQITNDRFDIMSNSISEISKITNTFNGDIRDMFSVTEDTFGNISHITDRVFMSLAKLDHVIWKVNTYLSVAQKKEAFSFVDHKNCRLGKWYSKGEGKKYFSSTPSYKSLDRPHSVVHNSTHKVFDDIKKHELDYIGILRHFEEMESASSDVFKILDRILKERF